MDKVLVVGGGISGKGATKLLKTFGFRTYLVDDKKSFKLGSLKQRLFDNLSMVVVSPGVELSHELVVEANKRGIEVVGELELAGRYLISDNIAITGTNGKTTTTLLTGHLLEGGDRVVRLGGNIGKALSTVVLDSTMLDITVIEVSSFQLETIRYFKPRVACLLNITEDHLNRHKTMENYIKSKFRIFENQEPYDKAILNLDDKVIMAQDLSLINAEKFYFSTSSKCKGCYVFEDKIYFNDGKDTKYVLDVQDIPLKGKHNLSNALAAILNAILIGEKIENIKERIKSFKGAKHRLEFVAEVNGVTFINDSKATNISSTLSAMHAMTEHFTLLLGGSDKGYEFDQLFLEHIPLLKNIIVFGETKQKILDAVARCEVSNVYETKSFNEAIKLGYELSEKNEVVLLSPACASFDMFSNFEERGDVFCKIVRNMQNRRIKVEKTKKEVH